ncbi:ELWxxDGT repeat protein [Kerstersia gyiorum]|uniref:ELWxxDGT repeat protein n=2 Tax=Kerstersia gyiorum TaxID=206506 RepID=A0A4V2F0E9_9BURK|nr:ELWxxDGT repeat protein [Kerstersia gyiorum]
MLIRNKTLWLALFGSLVLTGCPSGGADAPPPPTPNIPDEEPEESVEGLNLRVSQLAKDVTLEVKLNHATLKTFTGTGEAQQNLVLSKLQAGDVLELGLPSVNILDNAPYACEFAANASMDGTLSDISGQGLNQKVTLTGTPENALYEVDCGRIHIVPAAYSGDFNRARYGWRSLNLDSGRSRWLAGEGGEPVVYVTNADETDGSRQQFGHMEVHWNEDTWRFVGAKAQGTTSYVYGSTGNVGIEQSNAPVANFLALSNNFGTYPVWTTIRGAIFDGEKNYALSNHYYDDGKNKPEDCGVWRWYMFLGTAGARNLNSEFCNSSFLALKERSAVYALGDTAVQFLINTGELKTIGTASATIGTLPNRYSYPIQAENKLYFPGSNIEENANVISVTDGTTLSSFDTNVRPSSGLGGAVPLRNQLIFISKDADELWMTDGTAAGTKLVKRLSDKKTSPGFGAFQTTGNKVFFLYTDQRNTRLWVSDGTEAGTHVVDDNLAIQRIENGMAVAGNRLVFLAGSPNLNSWTDNKLYSTDGTTVERLVPDELLEKYDLPLTSLLPCAGCNPQTVFYHSVGGQLLLQVGGASIPPANGESSKRSVHYYLTDGTAAGTRPLRDESGKSFVRYLLSIPD